MVEKKGKIPVTTRVDVDYSEGKPKIKFGYTKKNPKKEAYKENFSGWSLMILLLIWYVFSGYLLFYQEFEEEYPQECNVRLNEGYANVSIIVDGYEDGEEYNSSKNTYKKFVKGADFECNNGNFSVYFAKNYDVFTQNSRGFYHEYSDEKNILLYLIILIIALGLVFIFYINKFIVKWLIKQKWYREWIPKNQAGGKRRRKKYYKYLSKDVLDNVIVIPSFKNVELTYNTSGDFSKELNKIKVREYRYYDYKKGKKGKLRIKNTEWYALFSFKKTPKTGYLEVFYQ